MKGDKLCYCKFQIRTEWRNLLLGLFVYDLINTKPKTKEVEELLVLVVIVPTFVLYKYSTIRPSDLEVIVVLITSYV